jgi:hypothetical protein
MTLSEINKKDILDTFHSLDNFIFNMSKGKHFADYQEKLVLENMQLYYCNLFYYDVDMVYDVITLQELTQNAILTLKGLILKKDLFIYRFLLNRKEKNCLYVKNIKRLA